ncbi:phasin family protein [Methylocapsa aurea]|uniref:phasin family protein n=1 Tax=Methylocapsa aurea TaxID=663610 RepID=UPI00056C0F8D|nr:phasin family protein [Methylocapsa aurea]
MAYQYDDFQQVGKEQLEAVTTTTASLAKSWQTIAAEATEFSKKSLETNSAFLEKLLGAKSFDTAIQIQSEYAKTSYAGFIAQATRLGELYSNLAKEAFKPIEAAITKVQSSVKG